MAAGRPVKCTPEELHTKFTEYIKKCKDSEEFANIAGLCVFLDISRETYYEYKNNRKEYSDTISKIERKLEDVTIQKGMERSNSFVQFYMKNKFGYSDKQEIDYTETHSKEQQKELDRLQNKSKVINLKTKAG